MSAIREENATESFVKSYITASLEQLARRHLLKSSDELVDYLLEEVRLDRPCTEWINTASNAALRELLRVHQMKFHQYNTGAGQASTAAPGPSAQRFANHFDSAYFSSDPGSPISERVRPRVSRQGYERQSLVTNGGASSQESTFDVFLVPAAAPDTEPIPALARIDAESDTNIIDHEIAKSVCGDLVREGQRVRVCCRHTQDDHDGSDTTQIQCVVGRIHEVNIVFGRDFGRLKARSEPPSGRGLSVQDTPGLDRARAKYAALIANELAEQEVLYNRKRPPDDDEGSQRLAQRPRRDPG